MNHWRRTIAMVAKIAGWGAVMVFTLMVAIALVQLLLRWFFHTGLPWADIQLRHLLLWLALLGGLLATARDRHIHIDMVEHYLPSKINLIIGRIQKGIAALISGYLALASLRLLQSEAVASQGQPASHPLLSLIMGSIIPITFALIALYFLNAAITAPAQKEATPEQ